MELQGSGLQLYLKKTLAKVVSCEFCEISKNTFFKEHILATASENKNYLGTILSITCK